jgi:hypothetical protein
MIQYQRSRLFFFGPRLPALLPTGSGYPFQFINSLNRSSIIYPEAFPKPGSGLHDRFDPFGLGRAVLLSTPNGDDPADVRIPLGISVCIRALADGLKNVNHLRENFYFYLREAYRKMIGRLPFAHVRKVEREE